MGGRLGGEWRACCDAGEEHDDSDDQCGDFRRVEGVLGPGCKNAGCVVRVLRGVEAFLKGFPCGAEYFLGRACSEGVGAGFVLAGGAGLARVAVGGAGARPCAVLSGGAVAVGAASAGTRREIKPAVALPAVACLAAVGGADQLAVAAAAAVR